MKEDKKTGSAGSFFKVLLANIIVLFFIAACVYQCIYKFNNLSSIAEKTITRFAINAEWVDIILYFCLAVLLIVLLFYIDKTKIQKRRRDKKITKLETTIEELKYKNENTPKIIETQSNEESLVVDK